MNDLPNPPPTLAYLIMRMVHQYGWHFLTLEKYLFVMINKNHPLPSYGYNDSFLLPLKNETHDTGLF